MSWRAKSIGTAALNAPLMPPMRNIVRNPIAKISGVENVSWPRNRVKTQLNILTPVGTAIRNVIRLKKGRNTAPVVNMWCAQTENPSAPIPAVAKMNALYPKSGFRLKTGRTSLITPMAGRTMTYTAGCE